ncbi:MULTISPECIES: TonB-dependent siderophore receptor [unclassified Microbulbifer]|uniref:TonB-dependent siderophore receptor n=1 Tax=unclassified Microbulbifer TaxID=2619833 RepID=UPI0027E57AF2|nr:MULTISPECIES: TonB-dependent siderophore receptor [unclassified Microbulbifer]
MNPRLSAFASLSLAVSLALPSVAQEAESRSDESGDIEEVFIVGVRENRTSKGATGLNLDLKSTPQSISVVDRELMDAFGASSINDALDLATGISVERWETNRTNYLSRGFEIQNTQVDGVGLPNGWGLVRGATDSFGYEKVEIIRGANGLLTGVGNSSGTINYVRKRPANHARGQLGVTAGSYDRVRVEADYSAPLSGSGDWAGRLVAAAEDSGSHLRGVENDRTFIYGVVDGQLTENSTLAAGYSHQAANTVGGMWGGLVFANSDGTQAEWGTDASTSQDWTYWDTVNQTAFVEYSYRLPSDWELKLSYNYRGFEDESQLFFAYSTTGLDPKTGTGLLGNPGKWPTEDEAHLFDAGLSGEYELFGAIHEAVLGASHSASERDQYWHPVDTADPAFGALPGFPYGGDVVAEPAWGDKTLWDQSEQTLSRVYGATRLKFGSLSIIPGFNAVSYERSVTSLRGDIDESEVSPYLGLTYSVTGNISVYASYSDIYQPQDQYDIDGVYLDPTKGVNYELGAKADWLDGRLLATLAVFKAEQRGLATYAGLNPDTLQYYYEGANIDSEGFEIEVSGALNEYMNLVLGFTSLELEDEAGDDSYTWVPRKTVNFSLNATLPQLPDVSLGLGGNWQAETSKVDSYTEVEIEQGAYLLLNAFARWDIDANSRLQLNVNNLTDEKYITSLYEIGYYGAPRNMAVSYQYTF